MTDKYMTFEFWDDADENGVTQKFTRKPSELKEGLRSLQVGQWYDVGDGKAYLRVS
jgi:hypothetical protein